HPASTLPCLLSMLSLLIPPADSFYFFFLLLLPPPLFTLFPYTTLFRSPRWPNLPARTLRCAQALPRPPHQRHRPHAHRCRARHRSEEHTSELQSPDHLVCRLLLEKKKQITSTTPSSPHVTAKTERQKPE